MDQRDLDLGGGRARLTHGLVIAGVTTLAGFLLLAFGAGVVQDHELISLAIFVVAGGVVVFAVRQSKAAPSVQVNEEGLWYDKWQQTIPWRAVEDCYISGSRLRPFVILKLRAPEAFLAQLSDEKRHALTRSSFVRLPELRVPASETGGKVLELRDFIRERLEGGNP